MGRIIGASRGEGAKMTRTLFFCFSWKVLQTYLKKNAVVKKIGRGPKNLMFLKQKHFCLPLHG